MVAITADYAQFAAGYQAARDAVTSLSKSISNARPRCPECQRLAVFVNSHKRGEFRVKGLGCKRCRQWSLGSEVVPVNAPRTRAVISTIRRTQSGRFASQR